VSGAEVAAVVGPDGLTAPLNSGGKVAVWSRDQGVWSEVRASQFTLEGSCGLKEMRERMAELIGFLGPCRLLVVRSASGVPFFEMEKAGFTVWEIPGRPEGFLDQVLIEEERVAAEAAVVETEVPIPKPREESPGEFAISIKDVQKCRPELSSKKVLQSFIRSGKFKTLTIECDHVPPWIEMERPTVGFTMESTRSGGVCTVKLTKLAD